MGVEEERRGDYHKIGYLKKYGKCKNGSHFDIIGPEARLVLDAL